jgi:hypothetical protein
MVGSLEQYPNETAAQKAVAALRADINAESPRTSLTPISVQTLLDKNEEKPSTEAYRTVTDLQNSGGDLQVVDKVGVPDGI